MDDTGNDTGKILLIGGSGIDEAPAFQGLEWKVFATDLKNPIGGDGDGEVWYQETDDGVIFIPRHGRDGAKRFGPRTTQYAANLLAGRMLGARKVIATSAVGSLTPQIPVYSLVIPDDYIDHTKRDDNLFGCGIVVHANPIPAFSPELMDILFQCGEEHNHPDYVFAPGIHRNKTYVCIDGDRFGTKAEGRMRQLAGADIVGMTLCPEASYALQLDMEYAVACFPVDMDLDANHDGQTRQVMKDLSQPHIVPAYIEKVIEKVKAHEYKGCTTQLKGNIIPGDTNRIRNRHLRKVADELIVKYCKD